MIYLKMDDLPAFTNTPVESIPAIHERIASKFHSHTTPPHENRH